MNDSSGSRRRGAAFFPHPLESRELFENGTLFVHRVDITSRDWRGAYPLRLSFVTVSHTPGHEAGRNARGGFARQHSRANIQVPLRGDLVNLQGLDVPGRVQNLRGSRALVQRHNLGFVPHAIVGPVQL